MMPSILALALLAGCISEDEPDDAQTIGGHAAPAVQELAWGLSDCQMAIAIVPVPADAVQPHLAEGFTAAVPDAIRAMLPPDPRMEGILGIEAFSCAAGEGLNGTIADITYGSIWTGVEAPANATGPKASLTFYKWDTLVPDDERREVLGAAGLPVHAGGVSLDPWATTPVGLAMDMSFRMDDVGAFRIAGAGLAPTTFAGDFTEYQPGDAGHAIWYTNTSAGAAYGGAGYVELAPGSVAEQIVGSARAQAYLLSVIDGAFTDSFIRLP